MKSLKIVVLCALSCFMQHTLVYGVTNEEIEFNSELENRDLLVEAIQAGNEKELIEQFRSIFDSSLINTIFHRAIDKCAADTNWFTSLVEAQLKLHEKYSGNGDVAKRNLIAYATNLYKLVLNKRFRSLSDDLIKDVKTMWYRMPKSANLLLEEPKFCLMNDFNSHYIYTAIKPDESTTTTDNKIWLWYNSETIDETSNIISEIKKIYVNGYQFDVTLRGTYYPGMYYIMSRTANHEVVGWDSPDTPRGHVWTMEYLDDDRVLFYQNGLLMCTLGDLDGERFAVAGSNKYPRRSAECQWRLRKCL